MISCALYFVLGALYKRTKYKEPSTKLSKFPLSHVREVSPNCRRRGHHRTHEMRASAATLTPFEVSITRRRTALARLQSIGVHAEAHRASRLAPFKTRFVENAIEPFAFRGLL